MPGRQPGVPLLPGDPGRHADDVSPPPATGGPGLDPVPRRPGRPPRAAARGGRDPAALRSGLSDRGQLHPELPHAGAGRPGHRPRLAAVVELVPVQRDAAAGRVQRRRRLPGDLADGRLRQLHRLGPGPGPGLRRGPGRHVPVPPAPARLVHRGHVRRRDLRLRRLPDRPDGPHRPARGGDLAAVDAVGRPGHDRAAGRWAAGPAGAPAPPAVGRPAGPVDRPGRLERRGRGVHRQLRAGRRVRARPAHLHGLAAAGAPAPAAGPAGRRRPGRGWVGPPWGLPSGCRAWSSSASRSGPCAPTASSPAGHSRTA